jgi:hypothetical protein
VQPSLFSARAKIERSQEHIVKGLIPEIQTYLDGADEGGPPYELNESVEPSEDDGPDWRVLRLSVLRPPPERFGLILGDSVHNLRSALDHTATQLWHLNRKTPPLRGANFPIYADPPDQQARHRIPAAVKGMRREHADLIRAKQPYKAKSDPQAQALRVVAAFDNLDKHEAIHPVFMAAQSAGLRNVIHARGMPGQEHEPLMEIEAPDGRVNDGEWLMRARALDARAAGAALNSAVVPSLGFGSPAISLERLLDTFNHVIALICDFDPAFPVQAFPEFRGPPVAAT